MNRRRFVQTAGAGILTVAGGLWACQGSPTLPIPETRVGFKRLRRREARGALTAGMDAAIELGDDRRIEAWGYDGSTPGPVLRLRRGDTLDLTVRNALSQETTVHWHGLLPPPEMDGHPADSFAPGSTRRYVFPIDQRAGLSWYHPHPHRRVAEQVYRGLAGPILITDGQEDALGLPPGADEHVLILGDGELGAGSSLRYRSGTSSDRGGFPLVNGAAYPEARISGSLQRLRIVNAARARVFELGTRPERPLAVIGNDGGLLDRAQRVDRVTLGPGERVDLLMDPRSPAGDTGPFDLWCFRTSWSLVAFNVLGGGRKPGDLLPDTPPVAPLPEPAPGAERTFRFEGHSRINGTRFRMDQTAFRVPFGRTERWHFRSSGGTPHPIHVHGAHFQVESRRGGRGRVLPWERGWKDTVLLLNREEVSVRIRFDRYPGRYLLHCHRLEHEDEGMMLNFEVEA